MPRLRVQLREWTQNFLADLLHPLVHLTPVEAIERSFGPRWLPTKLVGHRAVVIEAHDIHTDVGLRQFLSDHWISAQRLAIAFDLFSHVDDVVQGSLHLHLRPKGG